MAAVVFEILILLIFPPLKLLMRLFGPGAVARVQRWEDAVFHQVHAMGAEARTIQEIERRNATRQTLASSAVDFSGSMPHDNLDATERARRTVGADLGQRREHMPGEEQLQRGPRQAEAANVDRDATRSEQMKEAMLEAQRLRNAQQQRGRSQGARRLKRRRE